MINRFLILLTCIAGISFTSCETEFSLNGEYQETPVIFGLIDHLDSVHYVKITKAFLGDGDNLVYAKTADSSYFNEVYAQVIELEDGEETGRSWILNDTILTTKSTDGIFYAPEQKVYVFYAADLDPQLEYQLTCDINEGKLTTGATTTLLPGFDVQNTIKFPSYKLGFANNSDDQDEKYNTVRFTVTKSQNASDYEVGYTVTWTEYYLDGSNSTFTEYRRDKVYTETGTGNFYVVFQGLEFYRWLGETIPDDDQVERRTLDNIDINIAIAHTNLSQYIAVTKPVSSIAQVKPEFTNIDEGYGLFSSRIIYKRANLELDILSTRELCSGLYTATKLFCE